MAVVASISPVDTLLALGHSVELIGSGRFDTGQNFLAVTTGRGLSLLFAVLVCQTTARSLDTVKKGYCLYKLQYAAFKILLE